MKSFLSFYLRYILFFLGIQMIFNIVFLLIHQDFAQNIGMWDQLLALVYGLKQDVSLTGYILIFPTVLLFLFSIFRRGIFKLMIGIYTFLILLCLIPAYFANLILYQYWNFPIDRSIFDYISTPADMIASLSPLSLIFSLVTIALVIYAFHFQAYKKWVTKPLSIPQKRDWLTPALFLIILPSLILPIRGGWAKSPMTSGSVYFHENAFINHAAMNPVWNLFYSMVEGDKLTQSANFFPDKEVQEIMEELYVDGGKHFNVLNTKSPNVILVLLESFAQPVITELGGNGKAAPNFNRLIPEGIFFNNFFASGSLTSWAIGAILAGYPSLPGTCILYYESKAQKLPNLNQKLKSSGYNSAFLYGGDIDFAHIKSFLVMGGFESIISDKDFSRSIPRSNWGVPDHYLFQRLIDEADEASSPFFHMLLTLSSHTPFDVPMETVFPGTNHLAMYENSIYYTDQALGEFIKTAKTRDWWDQTLIILMADHGCRIGNIRADEKKRFSIPMLWLGGALGVNDTMITKYASQTDLPLTLLNQIGLPGDDFIFSKDILSENTESFAYYTFNDGIGFLHDSSSMVYSLVTRDYLLNENSDSANSLEPGLAYLQYLLNDFNNK